MGSFWNEINHSLQMSGKNPAFTIAVLITLALGTGTNTAIFSVVDAVLLKPSPTPMPTAVPALTFGSCSDSNDLIFQPER